MNKLKDEVEYRRALAEVDLHFADEPALGTPEGDRFQELLAQIGEYERVVYPMPETAQSEGSAYDRGI